MERKSLALKILLPELFFVYEISIVLFFFYFCAKRFDFMEFKKNRVRFNKIGKCQK